MKLYTEEEIRHRLNNPVGFDITTEEFIESLTPIELPSDEDIEKAYYKELEERRDMAKNFKGQVAGRHPDMFGHSEMRNMVRGYLEAIQSLRNKIKGDKP